MSIHKVRRYSFCLIAPCLVLVASPLCGATLTWDGSIGNWDTDTSWLSDLTEPTSIDDVIIGTGQVDVTLAGEVAHVIKLNGGVMNIEGHGSVSNSNSYIGHGSGSVGVAAVTGTDASWSNSEYLYVGYEGNGTLTIADGGSVSSGDDWNWKSIIGHKPGSSGAATVTGPNSTWSSTYLYVGDAGNGTLNIENGGSVSGWAGEIGIQSGSSGAVSITGAGSTLYCTDELAIGENGDGTLMIGDGGSVSVGMWSYIGLGEGSTSSVTVTGAGSTWNAAGLAVGSNGQGTMHIDTGGKVVSTSAIVGSTSGSTAIVTVTGAGSSWINSSDLKIGAYGSGSLTIQEGASVSNVACQIGDSVNASGVVSVTGTGSTWTNLGGLSVGNSGDGTLNIQDGGSVFSNTGTIATESGSTGTTTVTGPDSIWTGLGSMRVGQGGNGTLNIQGGGSVLNTTGIIGAASGSTGMVTVTGAGSAWTNLGNLNVGQDGNGSLDILEGGSVSNLFGYIGSSSVVTVSGAGSTWTSTRLFIGANGDGMLNIESGGLVSNPTQLYVGDNGNGTLTIRAGGTMYNGIGHLDSFCLIGNQAGSTGVVTVTGPGSTWINETYLTVGHGGDGTLNVLDGGFVFSDDDSIIANGSGSTGIVTVTGSGSTWNNRRNLYVGGSYEYAGGSGELIVNDGGLVEVGDTLKLWSTGSVTLVGGRIVTGTFDHTDGGVFNFAAGSLVVENFLGTIDQMGGTLAPGASPGTTSVSGDYNLNSGSIAIEIGGLTPGTEHDQVRITGVLNLGLTSVLDVTLINAFVIRDGKSFDILDWGSISGSFGTINLPTLDGNLDWDTSNLLADGTLSVFSTAITGDLDDDGFVGIADLHIILGNWNQNVPPGDPLADPSGDGFVGIEDLNTVLGNWNAGTPPTTHANIPEPATAVILILGMLTLTKRCL